MVRWACRSLGSWIITHFTAVLLLLVEANLAHMSRRRKWYGWSVINWWMLGLLSMSILSGFRNVMYIGKATGFRLNHTYLGDALPCEYFPEGTQPCLLYRASSEPL